MEKLITYMSREWHLDNIWVLQTNDPAVHKIMRQSKDFWVGMIMLSDNEWQYNTYKKTQQSAIRTLSRLTNGIVKKDAKKNIWYAISNSLVDKKNTNLKP